MKVTGFLMAFRRVKQQKETGDSFNSWGEGIVQRLEALPKGGQKKCHRPDPNATLPRATGGGEESREERHHLHRPLEAVLGGTPGAPCQCYLTLCPIGTFAPGGGEGIFPKKWVSCLNQSSASCLRIVVP